MNMFVSAAALTAGSSAAASIEPDDSSLLKLEEQIFEKLEAATAYDDEIYRLHEIWTAEYKRLYFESLTGRSALTSKEQSQLVREMPESKEHSRLVELQEPYYVEMDKLINTMWATPARTPEGRRAKLLVLFGCILDDHWRVHDGDVSYEIQRARDLMIEFVGGEPAEQLRNQFSDGPRASWAMKDRAS
jgi:hypothetical protein